MKPSISKEKIKSGEYLPLMEAFYTIQGEGYHQGTAAYFIRLGGCDVGCHWCDVKESWEAANHPAVPVAEIVQEAARCSEKVVVTGGEPLMWNLAPLTQFLKLHHIQTHIETSGAHPLSGTWDWICLSPKKMKLPLDEVYQKAHELKMIIYNKDDFRFAEEQAARVSKDCKLYLQPEWGKKDIMMPLMVDYVKQNPRWKISLQVHKYLDIP